MNPRNINRREMLLRSGTGVGMFGLAHVLSAGQAAAASESTNPLLPKPTHFPVRAKRMIHLFMNGGPSHVDTFDPKPALQKYAGQRLPQNLATERKTGAAYPSPFRFDRYGKSGIEVSELFKHTARPVSYTHLTLPTICSV